MRDTVAGVGAALDHVLGRPDLRAVLVRHARLGFRVQVVLRGLLVAAVVIMLLAVPPAYDRTATWVVVAAYAVYAVLVGAVATRAGDRVLRFAWASLLGDVAALAALALLAAASDRLSWTTDVLLDALFVVPVLAATQLRPWIAAVVGVPTVALHLTADIVHRPTDAEPWASVLLRSALLGVLVVAAVLLSRVQLSRVVAIARLNTERARLAAEAVDIERRERRRLAEHLHDGALQYLLAARHDLDEAREHGSADAFARVGEALRESSQLLRSTTAELHPLVLRQAGLAAAVSGLAAATAERSGTAVAVDTADWPTGAPTWADDVLFGAAREALGNVVKHARARTARVRLALDDDGWGRLEVTDDGVGLDPDQLPTRLAEGHVGLASQRARVAALDGRLTVDNPPAGGTVVSVGLPGLGLGRRTTSRSI